MPQCVVEVFSDAPNRCFRMGLEQRAQRAYSLPMNEIRPTRGVQTPPDLAPPGTPLHVAVAPDLLGREHAVIRADDDTDEDHESKQRLLDAMLAYAKAQG